MTEEEIKQRNESKEFLKDLQYYLFQNKRSPKIDKLSALLDNDEKRIVELGVTNQRISDECHKLVDTLEKKQKEVAELKEQNIKDCKNFNKTMKETKEQWNKEHYQLTKARKCLKDLVYVVELGKNELATARILAEAKEFLKEE